MKQWTRVGTALLACMFLACGTTDETDPGTTEEAFDDLVPAAQGKDDTGYLSTLAVELEGLFAAKLYIDISDKSEEEQEAYIQELMRKGWSLKNIVNDQMKCAKNKMNTEKLHMNLSAGEITRAEFDLSDEGVLLIDYEIKLETIASNKELEEAGIQVDDLIDKTVEARVPSNPEGLYDLIGDRCADGFDEGGLHSYNYFYYFAPDKEGCEAALAEHKRSFVSASFTITNPIAGKTVYPEYDRLTADSRIDAVVFFGAAKHDWEPGKWDWGVSQYEDFLKALERKGFTEVEAETGKRFHRKVGELDEYVDVVSPEALKLLKDDTDGLFSSMVSSHELIFYNGHSFYGSLSVLRKQEIYPPDTYQIFFMNSCWSYEYYTKQVFEAKVTEADPTGWALADVVNNTEPAWFHNMAAESRILLTNILAGAEVNGAEEGRYYTWDRIIGKMNEYASGGWVPSGKSHEIYGVSGVTSNAFEPE